MHKIAFGDNALGRTQIFEWIFTLETRGDLGGSVWESRLSFQRSHSDGAEKVREAVGEDRTKCCYGDGLRVRPLVWNIPANAKGGRGMQL